MTKIQPTKPVPTLGTFFLIYNIKFIFEDRTIIQYRITENMYGKCNALLEITFTMIINYSLCHCMIQF